MTAIIRHLFLGQHMLRKTVQAGIRDSCDRRMVLQKLSDLLGTFLLVDHAGCQRRETTDQKRPGTLRREYATKIFAVEH